MDISKYDYSTDFSREQTYYDNETVIDTTAIHDQDLVRPFRN
jgi:hypothetical protein